MGVARVGFARARAARLGGGMRRAPYSRGKDRGAAANYRRSIRLRAKSDLSRERRPRLGDGRFGGRSVVAGDAYRGLCFPLLLDRPGGGGVLTGKVWCRVPALLRSCAALRSALAEMEPSAARRLGFPRAMGSGEARIDPGADLRWASLRGLAAEWNEPLGFVRAAAAERSRCPHRSGSPRGRSHRGVARCV